MCFWQSHCWAIPAPFNELSGGHQRGGEREDSLVRMLRLQARLACWSLDAWFHSCPPVPGDLYVQPLAESAGTTSARHHTQLIFVFLVEMEFHHAGQAGLELLTSGEPSASPPQSFMKKIYTMIVLYE
ncbi:hypothetical protein AAY473_015349 [Plecturocebus cupreus]